ncbi:MAG TPA: HAD family phosphatase, partial [Acidimicrobiia bacterium]|nr:HAD family phosphatase [Acidimicrobiia bacterium]
MAYRAVIFDLGGVVFPSPLDGFRAYERERGLPHRFLSEVVLADPLDGAWSRLERGELTMGEFAAAFEAECQAAGGEIDAAALMGRITAGLGPRDEMVRAIRALRAGGFRVGALTNNWRDREGPWDPTGELFDEIVESAIVGLRKPDPAIYELACAQLGVEPPHVVFLDDLGVNLKPARAMGMATIKVTDP